MAIEDRPDQPTTIVIKGPVGVRLENELITTLQTIVGPGGHPVSVSGSGSGAAATRATKILQDQVSAEVVSRAEADGTERGQVLLWDYTGAAQIRAAGEPATGETRGILCGKDEALNVDDVRTDPGRILWVRTHEEYISVPSAELPAAEGPLWQPGTGDAFRYLVEFMIVNNDAGGVAAAGIYVGRDVNAGGALARPEWWMFGEVIVFPGNSGWRGPFYMHGDDDILGNSAVANEASIHFRVRRVDTGA